MLRSSVQSMEQTLYDSRGRAVAYVADDGETIYTWKGQAVAYLVDEAPEVLCRSYTGCGSRLIVA